MSPKKVEKKPKNNGKPRIIRTRKIKNNGEIDIPKIQISIPQNQQNILNGFGNHPEYEDSLSEENNIKILFANEVSGKNLQGKGRQRAVANNTIVINTEQLEQNKVTGDKQSEVKTQLTSPNTVFKRKPRQRPGRRARKKRNDKAKKNKSKEIESGDSKNTIIDTQEPLNLRRLSLAGIELSWTKDISRLSTSTCVTVSLNDFFRIDNKIPYIKLTNIDKQLRNYENGNDKEEQNNVDTELQCVKTPDIQVSSSSSSSSSASQESSHDVQFTPAISTLNKLASKLKTFDLEIMNWIGCNYSGKSNDLTNIHDKIMNNNFLQEEKDVLLQCQGIKRILSEYSPVDENEKENCDNHIEINVESNVNIFDNTKETTVEKSVQSNNVVSSNIEIKPSQLEDTAHNNTFNDEDDALSLFAESITDMESPRNWNLKSREYIEEYVPLSTKDDVFKRPEKVIYKPTRIENLMVKEAENAIELGICEKSNADSTSMYKNSYENIINYKDRFGEVEKTPGALVQNESILLGINQKPKHIKHSVLFKGICLSNLVSNCKFKVCKFSHTILDKDLIRPALRQLDDVLFQEEYVIVRAWPVLRRLYGICFLEDCIRRRLTRILIEMTLDLVRNFYNKEYYVLGVNAIETTLVYLNDTELHAYGNLMKQRVKNNILLCDVFLDTIAKSQNFSRFRKIFINLINFMCDIGCSFEINMANYVLERVCILPFNFNLAQALIKVIRKTDYNRFTNTIIKTFEHHLQIFSTELYEEFSALKDENSKSVSDVNCYNSPLDNDLERLNNPIYSENDIRYSPDTTELDNCMKTPTEPKFHFTMDLTKLKALNDLPNSSPPERDDIYTHRHHKTWINNRKSNYRPSSNLVRGGIPNKRPPLRPAFKRRSDQTFGSNPSKFPRSCGSTYFNN